MNVLSFAGSISNFFSRGKNVVVKLIDFIVHPQEILSILYYFIFYKRVILKKREEISNSSEISKDELFCYECLEKTSRSFSLVIMQLCKELRLPITIFYLILRAVDSIEDDTSIPHDKKIEALKNLFSCFSSSESAKVHNEETEGKLFKNKDNIGDGLRGFYNVKNVYEKLLLDNFDSIIRTTNKLKKEYRDCILDISNKTSKGMIKFLKKEICTLEEYNEYCYYVAGLVGIGLTKLFMLSNSEKFDFYDSCIFDLYEKNVKIFNYAFGEDAHSKSDLNEKNKIKQKYYIEESLLAGDFSGGIGGRVLEEEENKSSISKLSISMGLFLQKTNIIRDFYEDINQCNMRIFYPREIWEKYVNQFTDLAKNNNKNHTIDCINELIMNALYHIRYCLFYLSLIKNSSVFKFCAIPQVMAIATLEKCFNNADVYCSLVKIRKGETLNILVNCDSYEKVCQYFNYYLNNILKKTKHTNVDIAQKLKCIINVCIEATQHKFNFIKLNNNS